MKFDNEKYDVQIETLAGIEAFPGLVRTPFIDKVQRLVTVGSYDTANYKTWNLDHVVSVQVRRAALSD